MFIWLRALWSRRDIGSNCLIVGLIAVGLGTAALLYSTADQLILRPVRATNPDRLVRAGIKRSQLITRGYFAYKHFEMAQQVRSFAGAAADTELDVVAGLPGTRPVSALAHLVSGNYFSLLNATAAAGRVLAPEDAQSSLTEIPVILSDGARAKWFGGSADAIGTTLRIQGKPFTVVGVMPKDFAGISLDSVADLWLPFSAQAALSGKVLQDPESDVTFSVFARLHDDARAAEAAAEFNALYQSDARATRGQNAGAIVLEPINKAAFSEHDQFSKALVLLLFGFVVMLAMIVVNVAALLLVRSAKRAREIAIQVALGASRTQIMAAGLLGSLSLGLAGGLGALLVNHVLAPAVIGFLPPGRATLALDLHPTLRTASLVFAAAVGLGFLFGAAPAWRASRAEPQEALRGGSATRRSKMWMKLLVALQAAGALFVLVETALTLRTYDSLLRSNPGFEVRNLSMFTLNMDNSGAPNKSAATLATALSESARALPGVESVSYAASPLMQKIGLKTSVALPGSRIEPQSFLNTSFNYVSADYFSTLGIPVLAGRSLSSSDADRANPTPVLINTALSRQLFGREDPLGKSFGSGPPQSIAGPKFIVVGVVGNSKYRSLRESMPPIFYAPFRQGAGAPSGFTMYVRAASSPSDIAGGMRTALFRLDPTVAFSAVSTMGQTVRDSVWAERLTAALGFVLSLVTALTAATGLYGMLSYYASQRHREFGIRLALGATAADLGRLLAKEAAVMLASGLAIAMAGHVWLAPSLSPLLFGVGAFDPAPIFWAVLSFAVISAMAAYAPIRKVFGVPTTIALKDVL